MVGGRRLHEQFNEESERGANLPCPDQRYALSETPSTRLLARRSGLSIELKR